MGQVLLLRALRLLVSAWLIASAVFLLSRTLPGRAPQLLADDRPTAFGQQAAYENRLQQRLGLQQPVFYFSLLPWRWHGSANQYHRWLRDLARGHLGSSFRDGVAVETHLARALRVTLPLTGSAFVLAALLTLVLAQLAARSAWWHRLLTPTAYLFDGLPLFVLGALLLFVFANPDVWPLFPAYGLPPDYEATWLNTTYHLVLPIVALALTSVPALFLPFVAALRQQWQQPYVATARAKGASIRHVSWRHVLPNALPVLVARLSELLPGVVAGAVVAEVLFALPGTGRLLAEAATTHDLPVLVGGVLLLALVRLLAWLLADVINAFTDPRISWS